MNRAKLLNYHRWAGLIFGILLFVQGLSGSLLLFRDEIEGILIPALHVSPAPAQPTQALIALVQTAQPKAQLQRVEFPDAPGRAWMFKMKDANGEPLLVAVDPANGAIVRQGGLGTWPTEWLFRLHETLLAGDVGDTIVGIEGIALVFMVVTGPIIWWPGAKRPKSGLSVITGSGADRTVRTLHRSAGAILAVMLLVSATTGVLMVFKAGLAPVINAVATVTKKPAPKVEPRNDVALVPVDTLIADARSRYGNTALRELRFSGKQAQVVAIYLEDAASLRSNAARQIYYDRYTGAEVAHYVPSTVPGGSTFIDWLFPIHTGEALGIFGRLLILCGGLGLVFFSASGIWLWLSARSRKRKAVAKRAAMGNEA